MSPQVPNFSCYQISNFSACQLLVVTIEFFDFEVFVDLQHDANVLLLGTAVVFLQKTIFYNQDLRLLYVAVS